MEHSTVTFLGRHGQVSVELIVARQAAPAGPGSLSVTAVMYGPDGVGRGWVRCTAEPEAHPGLDTATIIERLGAVAVRRVQGLVDRGQYRGPLTLRLPAGSLA